MGTRRSSTRCVHGGEHLPDHREARRDQPCGAPTAFRLLVAAGPEAAGLAKGRLRVVSSAGEPLNPEVIRWFAQHLGVTIPLSLRQYGDGMVVCNHHGLDHPVRPVAAGFPMPGYRIVVLGDDLTELPRGPAGRARARPEGLAARVVRRLSRHRDHGLPGRLLSLGRYGGTGQRRRHSVWSAAPTTSSPRPATGSVRSMSKAR